jgi:putative ABC transport system ATP-binding protein/lipoprotein-releasing system ATP-binding protein
MAPLVSCREASRTYDAFAWPALQPVTCDVSSGDRVALMGPSGSGKSTLLHIMAGLDRPTGGVVTWPAIGDRDALRPGPIGMVFQGTSLLPPLSVIENVALPLLLAGRPAVAATAAAHGVLSELGLDALAAKLPEEISGGQAQRVAIARALVGSPLLILADEPTSQLDSASASHVIDVLLDAADNSGAALVVATHDADIAARLEHCWAISDGRLATDRSLA